MECKHEDGWNLIDPNDITINTKYSNDNLEAEFVCNTIGCSAKKKFKFDIENIQEIKEKK